MKHPLDKWSRDYTTLLAIQAEQLLQWKRVLIPEVYADLETHCRYSNEPVTEQVIADRRSLTEYKAGGLHICPVGCELHHRVMEWGTAIQSLSFLNLETEKQKQKQEHHHTMKEVSKKLSEILVLLAAVVAALPVGAADGAVTKAAKEEPTGPSHASLTEIAEKKDPKLVLKVLKKFGADTIEELEESDFEKAQEKLEGLDDAEAEEEKPAPTKGKKGKEATIDLEALRTVAQELITAGKSSAIKKILAKFDAESISKLDEKHYDAVHAKLTELVD